MGKIGSPCIGTNTTLKVQSVESGLGSVPPSVARIVTLDEERKFELQEFFEGFYLVTLSYQNYLVERRCIYAAMLCA